MLPQQEDQGICAILMHGRGIRVAEQCNSSSRARFSRLAYERAQWAELLGPSISISPGPTPGVKSRELITLGKEILFWMKRSAQSQLRQSPEKNEPKGKRMAALEWKRRRQRCVFSNVPWEPARPPPSRPTSHGSIMKWNISLSRHHQSSPSDWSYGNEKWGIPATHMHQILSPDSCFVGIMHQNFNPKTRGNKALQNERKPILDYGNRETPSQIPKCQDKKELNELPVSKSVESFDYLSSQARQQRWNSVPALVLYHLSNLVFPCGINNQGHTAWHCSCLGNIRGHQSGGVRIWNGRWVIVLPVSYGSSSFCFEEETEGWCSVNSHGIGAQPWAEWEEPRPWGLVIALVAPLTSKGNFWRSESWWSSGLL